MRKIIFLFCSLIFVMTSCVKDDAAKNDNQITKQELLASDVFYKNFWIVQTDNIIKNNDNSISEIIALNKYLKENFKGIKESQMEIMQFGLKIAKTMNEESFIRLFTTVNNKDFIIHLNGPKCDICISDIRSEIADMANRVNQLEIRADYGEDAPDCNCKWTCGGSMSVCTLEECNGSNDGYCCYATTIGCGFLLLGSCDGYDTIDPSRCP